MSSGTSDLASGVQSLMSPLAIAHGSSASEALATEAMGLTMTKAIVVCM